MIAVTEGNASFGDTLFDEFGIAIKLDQSPEELKSNTRLANPTNLKDSSGREVVFIENKPPDDGKKLTPKQAEAMEAKSKKKKTS
jgi:hypothetical protein